MILSKRFPGNHWDTWREGHITVGGAGGVPTNDSFQPGMVDSFRNRMVMANCHYHLPVAVAVEHCQDLFQYIGMIYQSSLSSIFRLHFYQEYGLYGALLWMHFSLVLMADLFSLFHCKVGINSWKSLEKRE